MSTRPGCDATEHDTYKAYKKAGCRCPRARQANRDRGHEYRSRNHDSALKAKSLVSRIVTGIPPFHADPRRACADVTDPEIFFTNDTVDIARAKKICARCPLAKQCAVWSIQHVQIHGIWGGMTPGQRKPHILRVLRQRGEVSA